MQISDLLGKYGQNTVPVTAQEQAVKTGTQQLTGTLSSLQTGNVFEGTVTDKIQYTDTDSHQTVFKRRQQ